MNVVKGNLGSNHDQTPTDMRTSQPSPHLTQSRTAACNRTVSDALSAAAASMVPHISSIPCIAMLLGHVSAKDLIASWRDMTNLI